MLKKLGNKNKNFRRSSTLKCAREIKETNAIRLHPKVISTENTGRFEVM